MDSTTPYHKLVEHAEESLELFAQRSLDPGSPTFLNGKPVLQFFQDQWQTQLGQRKLDNRTPLQLERDRILYSSALRKQTEKYHVLYSGQRRIIRNYTTHTMRMAHVTRAICKGLGLNSDFAEAIAIGSKVGAAPFIHRTKDVAHEWLRDRLIEIGGKKEISTKKQSQISLFGAPDEMKQPHWISEIESQSVVQRALKVIPLAFGDNVDALYHSGAESYWLLCTQPYSREPGRGNYHPETMFGIWRHSRNDRPRVNSFYHRCEFENKGVHSITWEHSTYEGLVVQFADDMTWIIENLNDANDAALLEGKSSNLFAQLRDSMDDVDEDLTRPLLERDPGGLYTYFISDFVRESRKILQPGSGPEIRVDLRAGKDSALIGPSPEGSERLDHIQNFLKDNVFRGSRIKNRNRMLESVSKVSLDLLYDRKESTLEKLILDRANLENWSDDKRKIVLKKLSDDVHRAQLAIDVFASLGDQEVFELVGIQTF